MEFYDGKQLISSYIAQYGSYLIIEAVLKTMQEVPSSKSRSVAPVSGSAPPRPSQFTVSAQPWDTDPVSQAESPVQQSAPGVESNKEVDGASHQSPDYAVT
jgi:hypothetical protein